MPYTCICSCKSNYHGSVTETPWFIIIFVLGSFYPWSPRDLTRAKAIMQYNLATAHAIRGEYDKAMANLVEVSIFIMTKPWLIL